MKTQRHSQRVSVIEAEEGSHDLRYLLPPHHDQDQSRPDLITTRPQLKGQSDQAVGISGEDKSIPITRIVIRIGRLDH